MLDAQRERSPSGLPSTESELSPFGVSRERAVSGTADSGTRGQVEPTVALVATAAICLSLGLYAVALGNAIPATDRELADPTLDRVDSRLSAGGVVVPAHRGSALAAGPSGYRTNVTIVVADRRWTAGPSAPPDADRATRQTGVRVDDDRVRAGTLRVAVWS